MSKVIAVMDKPENKHNPPSEGSRTAEKSINCDNDETFHGI